MAGIGAPETRITALNDHVLENLMNMLSLNDLASMAVSNSRFGGCADFVFKRKFANQFYQFDVATSTTQEFNNFANLLDAFGDSMRYLSVTFNIEQIQNERDRKIFAKINANCGKSVMELSLSCIPRDMTITKPFVNLRKLMIANSLFNDSMAQNLAGSAPNLSNMELHSVENVFNNTFVDLNIPALVHFGKFNEIIRNPEFEMENLQNFRRFMNANKQITSFGFGSNELSYMLKYKLMRQRFYNDMHPGVSCPDKRDFITYLFPFESVYRQDLNHLHIRLIENTDFLRILRHRLINIDHIPFEHVELNTYDLPLEVMDLLIQFRELKKLQYFVRNKVDPKMLEGIVSAPFVLKKLTDFDFMVLNDEELLSMYPSIAYDFGVLLKLRDGLQRITIGFELSQRMDENGERYDSERRIQEYQTTLHGDFVAQIPTDWHIEFEIQPMDVQRRRRTEYIRMLCVVLTKKLRANEQMQ